MRILPDKTLSAKVWTLAGPVVIGMISQTLMNLVDTAMVGRLGAVPLAAAGLGGILSWTVLGTLSALHIGTQAVAARRFGQRRMEEVGKSLDNALFLATVVGLIGTAVFTWLLYSTFGLFSGDAAVTAEGRGYVGYRLLGILPFMVISAHRGFFNGVGRTRLHMTVGIAMNLLNAVANWLLIFGNLGLPAMGTAGAGLASTVGMVFGMALFVGIGVVRKHRDGYGYYRFASNLDRAMLGTIVRLSVPSGVRILVVMGGFSLFASIVARLGTVEMATTNVVLTIVSMSYMPGAGFGTAAGSLIGQKLGEGRPDRAEEYGWEAGRLGVFTMGIAGIAFIFFPELLMRLFTNDAEVIRAGLAPLRLMGFIQVFDAMGLVLSGALEGAGLNTWVMAAEISVNWIFFLPATWLATHVLDLGLLGAWGAIGAYLTLYAVVVTVKFAGGGWKRSQV